MTSFAVSSVSTDSFIDSDSFDSDCVSIVLSETLVSSEALGVISFFHLLLAGYLS